jgi:hypothetical protein
MAAGKIEIINVALSRLGADPIISLTEQTVQQVLAVSLWDVARRACLREHTWNFAVTDVELNQVSGYVPFEYKYAYQLPANTIRLLQVYNDPVFKIQGRRILTNQEVCKIKYVADTTDSTLWDASFDDVMAQRLAFDMAYAITKSQATADSMYQIYAQKLKNARHIDSNEDVQDMLGPNELGYIGVRS